MDQFRTKDIYEASALIAAKARFLHLLPDKHFYWFVFEDCDHCRQISDSYWRNELKVMAKDLTEAIRTMKDKIHSNNQYDAMKKL